MVAACGGGRGRGGSSVMLRDLTETVGEGLAVEWLGVAGVTEDDVEGLEGMENMGDRVGDTVDGGGGFENWERDGKSCGTLNVKCPLDIEGVGCVWYESSLVLVVVVRRGGR